MTSALAPPGTTGSGNTTGATAPEVSIDGVRAPSRIPDGPASNGPRSTRTVPDSRYRVVIPWS
ncbi:hypothetical protein [Streptomyces sp. HUAS ZL42]|uniref:hypothetical protein n=1 Tax=Streptomyces sp. HUAS ZL42 TaxID=3231715 RepID=UPI00345E65B1